MICGGEFQTAEYAFLKACCHMLFVVAYLKIGVVEKNILVFDFIGYSCVIRLVQRSIKIQILTMKF